MILNKKTMLGLVLNVLFCPLAFAITAPELQTQNQLKQIDAKINHLQQDLESAHGKHEHLHQQLADTEKQIGDSVNKLRTIGSTMNKKEYKIASLQTKIKTLNEQLTQQQQELAKHIRTRYQMGEYQVLKWVINQEDMHNFSRILTYYEYIVSSRQQLIDKINRTRLSLNENQESMRKELAENKQLQAQLAQHQQQLVKDKRYHTQLMQTLDKNIQSQEHDLVEFKKNKHNLSKLLRELAKQSVVQANNSFAQMRRKLPLPVQSANKSLKRMNQGVTFFADEGAEVSAVYPGKVVFSDWLKGYGLLLIIDHGQGFMTLYAHNQSLFKRKGDFVHQGEQIASVGHSGGIRQNGLYFEVRVKGKAISPFEWLS